MDLIKQPNRWSCNACAWAMVLGLSLEEVVAAVGHDGAAIWDHGLLSPENRVGFSDEELIWLAVQRGYVCTEIALDVAVQSRYGQAHGSPKLCTKDDLAFFLPKRHGVLTVPSQITPGGLHAVAWDGEWVYDPMFGIKLISDYTPQSFVWVAKIVEQHVSAFHYSEIGLRLGR